MKTLFQNIFINSLIYKQMKKSVLFLAMIAAAMASCSKDETTELNIGEAISFRSSVGTRISASWTTESIGGFTLGAAYFGSDNQLLMKDVVFSKPSGDALYFTSPNAAYWPADGSDVTFYAYANTHLIGTDPTNLPVGSWSFTSTERKLYNFSQPTNLGNHTDFITAKATANSTTGKDGVPLSFNHQLAQVVIQCRNANANLGYQIEVRGVRLCNIKTNATFDFETEKWTTPTETETYEGLYANYIGPNPPESQRYPLVLTDEYADLMYYVGTGSYPTDSGGTGCLFSIPQELTSWNVNDKENLSQGAYIAIYAQIRTQGGSRFFPSLGVEDEFAWIAVPLPADTKWDAGMKYTYKINFSNGFGYVDPEKGEPNDPTKDPFLPGEPILGQGAEISVAVTDINGWNDSNVDGEPLPM